MKVISEIDLEKLKRGDTEPLQHIFLSIYKNCIEQVIKLSDCQAQDAEDLVMDAIIVLREKVMYGEYQNQNLQSFIVSVALNKWKNRRRKYNRTVFIDQKGLAHLQQNQIIDESNELNREKEKRAISMALTQMTGKCGTLLSRNLFDGIPLEILISELGYSNYNVIKSTKSRCMKKLRAVIQNLLNQ